MDDSLNIGMAVVCGRDENNTVETVWFNTIDALNDSREFSLSDIDDEKHTANVVYTRKKARAQFKLKVQLNFNKESIVYICTSKTLDHKTLDGLAGIIDSTRQIYLAREQDKSNSNGVTSRLSRFVAKNFTSILIAIIIILGLVINFTFCSGPSKSEHDGQRLYITSTGERVWVDKDTYDHLNGR